MNDLSELLEAHKKAHDKHLAYRLNALILLEKGYTHVQVSDALLIDEKTVRPLAGQVQRGRGIWSYEPSGGTGL